MVAGVEAARHEAVYKLSRNAAAVGKFACRGRGRSVGKQFQAPLADPYCEASEEYIADVDKALRVVAEALMEVRPL